jgi:hypothetical protein
MIQEIKLNGLNNEPVETNRKTPPMSINKVCHPVILHQYLLEVKARVKLIA